MSLDQRAAAILNQQAPPGERLAYLNPEEEGLLQSYANIHGATTGEITSSGVPSYGWSFVQKAWDSLRGKTAARKAERQQRAAISEAERKQKEQVA